MRNYVAEARALHRAGELNGSMTAEELLATVNALDYCVNTVFPDQKKAREKKCTVLFIGASLLISILFAIGLDLYVYILIAIAIILVVIRWQQVKELMSKLFDSGSTPEYDTSATGLLAPALRCLSPDISDGSLVSVRACLIPRLSSKLMQTEVRIPETGKYRDCIDRVFRRDLLTLEFRLRDNSLVKISVQERTAQSELSWKSDSGKLKTKFKNLTTAWITIQMQLDAGRCLLTGRMRLPRESRVKVRQEKSGARIFAGFKLSLREYQQLTAPDILGPLSGIYTAISLQSGSKTSSTGGEA